MDVNSPSQNLTPDAEEKIPMSIEKKNAPKKNFLEISCPYCFGANIVKRGLRKKAKETVQLYLCGDCKRTFTHGSTKGKRYPISVILDAISLYYIGYSLEEAAKKASAIYNSRDTLQCVSTAGDVKKEINNISQSESNIAIGMINLQGRTLLEWINQYEPLCAFARMRPFALKLFSPEKTISSATLAHRQLYRFRHHRSKTILIIQEDWKHSKFWPLKEFLDLVPVECPHQYFQEGSRASETPLMFSKTEMIVRSKHNFANKMAKFVLESVEESKDRHDALQRFMLANDSVTIATEVPIYLRREDLAHMQTQLGFELYKKPPANKGRDTLQCVSTDNNIFTETKLYFKKHNCLGIIYSTSHCTIPFLPIRIERSMPFDFRQSDAWLQ